MPEDAQQQKDQPRLRTYAHERIDHKFSYPLFDYDTPIKYQPCVKVSLFFSKRPDVSYEHFFKHYAHVHADMTSASEAFGIPGHNVLRYTQHHQTPEDREKVKLLGVDVLDYDACTTMWVRSWDDLITFHKSEQFKTLHKDCEHFMDQRPGALRALAGHDVIIVGPPIPGIDESGGIPNDQTGIGWKK